MRIVLRKLKESGHDSQKHHRCICHLRFLWNLVAPLLKIVKILAKITNGRCLGTFLIWYCNFSAYTWQTRADKFVERENVVCLKTVQGMPQFRSWRTGRRRVLCTLVCGGRLNFSVLFLYTGSFECLVSPPKANSQKCYAKLMRLFIWSKECNFVLERMLKLISTLQMRKRIFLTWLGLFYHKKFCKNLLQFTLCHVGPFVRLTFAVGHDYRHWF